MPSTKSSSSSAAKKVFDISKPGKSAPSATSKPIIITNRPILRDPMVAGDSETETVTAEKPAAPSQPSTRVMITPTTDTETTETASVSKDEAAETDTVTDSLPPDSQSDSESSSSKDEAADNTAVATPALDEAPVGESSTTEKSGDASEATPGAPLADTPDKASAKTEKVGEQIAKPQTPEEQEAAAQEAAKLEAEHDAAIQKLVDTKQYYLPINSIEKRKTKHFVIGGVTTAVVLGVAWVDVALDAGLIRLGGLKAVTHFFGH